MTHHATTTRILALGVLIGGLLTASARAVSIQTTVHDAADASSATLRARSLDKTGADIEKVIAIPGRDTIDLAAGTWELSIDAPSYWSEPRIVTAQGDASFDLWRAGSVEGTIDPKSRAKIATLRVTFKPSRRDASSAVAPNGETHCVIDDEKWRCALPAGVHDLRFGSPGFAAMYRWAVGVEAGRVANIGALAPVRGASLVGHVVPRDGLKLDTRDIRVTVAPRISGTTASAAYSAAPDARGFFQIAGLPPGDYLVSASAKGMRAEARPVRVLHDRNAELRSPLVLDTPKAIVLNIVPPLAGNGSPWEVHLIAEDREAGRFDPIATGRSNPDGSWKHEAVAGNYLLKVGDSDDGIWWSQSVEIALDGVTLEARPAATRVSGTVKLGGRPLAAKITFGGESGHHRKALFADEEGNFSGIVPAEAGKDGWEIHVSADAPVVRRTLEGMEPDERHNGELTFEIALPLNTVGGRVVRVDGTPVSHAIVTIQRTNPAEVQQVFSENDGAFELAGLRTGKYRIKAEQSPGLSDVVTVDIAEETSVEAVDLVLRETVRVKGRVITGNSAVIGAEIIALPRGVKFTTSSDARSNEAGYFELQLPPGTKTYDIIVSAFGFGIATARAEVLEGKMVMVPLDQHGGRLRIETPANARASLFHAGGEYPIATMARVGGAAVEARDGRQTLVLPEAEQGDYRLCVAERCTSGVLAPNGDLTLSLRP